MLCQIWILLFFILNLSLVQAKAGVADRSPNLLINKTYYLGKAYELDYDKTYWTLSIVRFYRPKNFNISSAFMKVSYTFWENNWAGSELHQLVFNMDPNTYEDYKEPPNSSSGTGTDPGPKDLPHSIFEPSPQTFHVNFSKFDNETMTFEMSREEYKDHDHPSLLIELKRVDYEEGAKYTQKICTLLLLGQAFGLIWNMAKICRHQDALDLDLSAVIMFYANSNILMNLESNRIQASNSIFDFVSFGSYYLKCLMLGIYVASFRVRIRQGDYKTSPFMMIGAIFLMLCILSRYYFSQEVESLVVVMYSFPIISQIWESFKSGSVKFSLGFTIIFKAFQLAQLLFLCCLEPPNTISPSNKMIVIPTLVYYSIVYAVVYTQYSFHPKLCLKWKYMKEEMKFMPQRMIVNDLPERENGYSCIICMEEMEGENEGMWTSCNHFFHEGCLGEWLKINTKCPICKAKCLPLK